MGASAKVGGEVAGEESGPHPVTGGAAEQMNRCLRPTPTNIGPRFAGVKNHLSSQVTRATRNACATPAAERATETAVTAFNDALLSVMGTAHSGIARALPITQL